jgi:hypothetical protein
MSRDYTMDTAKQLLGRYGFKFSEKVIHSKDAKDTSNRASGAIDYLIRYCGMVLGK